MNWKDKPQVKKGDIGERLVDDWIVSKAVTPYLPSDMCNWGHPFDRLCATKKSIFIAEVKTKEARIYYPDTGINISHYNKYKEVQKKHNLKVFIFFVDEKVNKIYGNWLNKLDKKQIIPHNLKEIKYPLKQNNIIYFPLTAMIDICNIPENIRQQIKQYTTINKKYRRNNVR